MRIQHHWRRFLIRRLLRRMARRQFKRVLDPILGRACYWTRQGDYIRHEPYIMGGERWYNNDMMQWEVKDIKLFIRRLGLKQYIPGNLDT